MVVLIAGASHTGKTALAQSLLEQKGYPYLSIDLLKMGLIRSGQTNLSPEDDAELTEYLWPIVREMIKTAIENRQNLVVEGGYIPFDWKRGFDTVYLKEIRYCCLVMSESYIKAHFSDIKKYANAVEQRIDDSGYTLEHALRDNAYNLAMCQKAGCPFLLIDKEYPADMDIVFETER